MPARRWVASFSLPWAISAEASPVAARLRMRSLRAWAKAPSNASPAAGKFFTSMSISPLMR